MFDSSIGPCGGQSRPKQPREFNGFCYELFTGVKNFDDAEIQCYNRGGRLAAFHSLELFEILLNLTM